MKTRVIIGAGTAAAVFLKTMVTEGWETVVVGSDGLWAQLPDKPMGQPAHLLQLPSQPVPVFQTASGGNEQDLANFLSAKTYQEGVASIVAGHRYTHKPERRVRRISKSLVEVGKVAVWFDDSHVLRADQVVVATGIGPQKKPPTIQGKPQKVNGYSQVIEGIEFLEKEEERSPKIDRFVYGGGATAAWVAAIAYQHSPRMGWFARPEGSKFSGADLPGIRNEIILSRTQHRLRSLESVEKVEVAGELLKIHVAEKDYYYVAHQFIYSLGGDNSVTAEGGIHQMIDKDLRDELSPFRDMHGALATLGPRLSDENGEKYDDFDPGNGHCLAWSTESGSLMIVGGATFNVAYLTGGAQKAPMATLPWNAQVPDGIAVIVATVSALNTYIPIKQSVTLGKTKKDWADVAIKENTTNINLADNNQLAVLFTLMFDDWSAAQVNQLVLNVIEARSRTDKTTQRIDKKSPEVFGISPKTFHDLVSKIRMTSEENLKRRFGLVGVEFK
jgi:hypothetical protein